jgi:hypothetical protein
LSADCRQTDVCCRYEKLTYTCRTHLELKHKTTRKTRWRGLAHDTASQAHSTSTFDFVWFRPERSFCVSWSCSLLCVYTTYKLRELHQSDAQDDKSTKSCLITLSVHTTLSVWLYNTYAFMPLSRVWCTLVRWARSRIKAYSQVYIKQICCGGTTSHASAGAAGGASASSCGGTAPSACR